MPIPSRPSPVLVEFSSLEPLSLKNITFSLENFVVDLELSPSVPSKRISQDMENMARLSLAAILSLMVSGMRRPSFQPAEHTCQDGALCLDVDGGVGSTVVSAQTVLPDLTAFVYP